MREHLNHSATFLAGFAATLQLEVERMLRALELSPEQKTLTRTVLEALRPLALELETAFAANSRRLRQLVPDDPDCARAVGEISNAQGTVMAQLVLLENHARASIFALLTSGQRRLLRAERDEERATSSARLGPPERRNFLHPSEVQI